MTLDPLAVPAIPPLDHVGGMPCPTCGERTTVRDSRTTNAGYIRRRRWCHRCDVRFATIEVPRDGLIEEDILAANEELRLALAQLAVKYSILDAAIRRPERRAAP